jgi:hypothetical protein
MNERIRELSKQAAEFVEENSVNWVPEEFEQKFAELIIIDVCNTLSEISNDDRIKKTTTDHMTKLFNGILEHVSEFLKQKYNVGVEL